MTIDSIKNGIVIDHIPAGKAMLLYQYLKLDGLDCSPTELAELVEAVRLEDVTAIARSVECDLIYFLTGSEDEEDEEE